LLIGVIDSRDSVSARFRKQVKMVSSVTGSMSPAAMQRWRAVRRPGSAGPSQPANPGLTSGLPRVVQGLSADVFTGETMTLARAFSASDEAQSVIGR
jgi:hypothetical protein